MAPMRTVLALLLLATLYVASLVLFPVEKVEVVGLRHLKPEDLLAKARLHQGDPWLWVLPQRLAPLQKDPWIAEVRLEKPRPGAVRLYVRERKPLLPLPGGDALSEDGVVLPGAGPLAPGPKVEGKGPLPIEVLLKLARAYPKAKALRYTPAGFWVVLDQSTLFAPEVRFLLEYAQVERPSASRVYLYSWGVSVRP
jgi:cell division protein FtsQ